jgi:hypothetical protein
VISNCDSPSCHRPGQSFGETSAAPAPASFALGPSTGSQASQLSSFRTRACPTFQVPGTWHASATQSDWNGILDHRILRGRTLLDIRRRRLRRSVTESLDLGSKPRLRRRRGDSAGWICARAWKAGSEFKGPIMRGAASPIMQSPLQVPQHFAQQNLCKQRRRHSSGGGQNGVCYSALLDMPCNSSFALS